MEVLQYCCGRGSNLGRRKNTVSEGSPYSPDSCGKRSTWGACRLGTAGLCVLAQRRGGGLGCQPGTGAEEETWPVAEDMEVRLKTARDRSPATGDAALEEWRCSRRVHNQESSVITLWTATIYPATASVDLQTDHACRGK